MSILPPHSIEAEQCLLGAIIMNQSVFDVLDRKHRLAPANFFEPLHGHLFERMQSMHGAGQRIDVGLTIAGLGSDAGIEVPGGMTVGQYIARLAAEATTIVNAPDYARTILDLHDRRNLLAVAEALATNASHVAPVDAATAAITKLDEIASSRTTTAAASMDIGQAAHLSMERLTLAMQNPGKIAGLTTGLSEVDTMLGGAQRGDLLVLAGRPGMGKTALAACVARKTAEAGHPVMFFSLEMGAPSLADRMLTDIAFDHRQPIEYDAIVKGRLTGTDHQRIVDAERRLRRLPIRIDPQAGLTVSQIASRARQHASRLERQGKRLGAIIVDHLHIVASSGRYAGQRVQEISETSAALKALAKEMDVPVIALAQLNRSVETRDDKRPGLADLRDSGAIEQDADVVIFAYREEYYLRAKGHDQAAEDRRIARFFEVQNQLELIVAKNRNGPVGNIELFCNIACNAIRNAESSR
jgi:replicative DNA helicase